MSEYTICFIRKGNRILLLNREHPRWMGRWNGIGGKIEKGESPNNCILREVFEETGIKLINIKFKGIINRIIDSKKSSNIYAFVSELSDEYIYDTPMRSSEGILDWKEIPWILHPQNTGVASDIPYFLPSMLEEEDVYEYLCIYKKNNMIDFNKYIRNGEF